MPRCLVPAASVSGKIPHPTRLKGDTIIFTYSSDEQNMVVEDQKAMRQWCIGRSREMRSYCFSSVSYLCGSCMEIVFTRLFLLWSRFAGLTQPHVAEAVVHHVDQQAMCF